MVKVAGRRWTVEERFQTGKGLCGLDQHQVRRWGSWYRWVTLAMLAHAFLVVAALIERTQRPPPPGLIGLTCNEVQHLFAALIIQPATDAAHRLRWSLWRRRTPSTRPYLPLPTTSRLATMNITIYGWSFRGRTAWRSLSVPSTADLGMAPGQPDRWSLNQCWKVRMLTSWEHDPF